MRDENLIRTLGDYSKLSHEGYRNTIELPVGNNVDFLKLVDSFDLDGGNKERTRLRLFQFSLRDQASNWLEYLPAGSITTWEDLTTHLFAQFFPSGTTTKLFTRRTINQLVSVKLRDRNVKESWALLEDLALYDNESWNNPRDFAKLVKSLPHVKSVVVLMALGIAWKIPNKPLLNTYPRVPMKREVLGRTEKLFRMSCYDKR
nr:hypothetical protein [Tanacetum cinerariifolium]